MLVESVPKIETPAEFVTVCYISDYICHKTTKFCLIIHVWMNLKVLVKSVSKKDEESESFFLFRWSFFYWENYLQLISSIKLQ